MTPADTQGHPLVTITETGQLWTVLVQKWGHKRENKIQMDSVSFQSQTIWQKTQLQQNL